MADAEGKPAGLLTRDDAMRAINMGSTDLTAALRTDFEVTSREATLNENYQAAGRGLPIAVVDANGTLEGSLDPREILEEMGRVETLIDGFEREVFM